MSDCDSCVSRKICETMKVSPGTNPCLNMRLSLTKKPVETKQEKKQYDYSVNEGFNKLISNYHQSREKFNKTSYEMDKLASESNSIDMMPRKLAAWEAYKLRSACQKYILISIIVVFLMLIASSFGRTASMIVAVIAICFLIYIIIQNKMGMKYLSDKYKLLQ